MIETLTSPCWTLSHESDDERDWTPHYLTREEAQGDLDRERREDALTLRPGESPNARLVSSKAEENVHRCGLVKCDGCGAYMQGEAGGTLHVNPDEADSIDLDISGDDWTTDGAGHHHCGAFVSWSVRLGNADAPTRACERLFPIEECEHDDDRRAPYCGVCHDDRGIVMPAREVGPLDDPFPGLTA